MKKTPKVISVVKAKFMHDKTLRVTFNDGTEKELDFTKAFSKLGGYYSRFAEPKRFKRFIVRNGNLYWGRNEDVIYSTHSLYTNTMHK